MSNVVKNTAGGDTGNARNGGATVNTGGRGAVGQIAQFYSRDHVPTPLISTIENLDGRIDDPRYYTGDLVT